MTGAGAGANWVSVSGAKLGANAGANWVPDSGANWVPGADANWVPGSTTLGAGSQWKKIKFHFNSLFIQAKLGFPLLMHRCADHPGEN